MSSIWKNYATGALLSCLALIAAGCGSDDDVAPAAPTTTLTGNAVKGPVKGGTVEVYKMTDKGEEANLIGTSDISTDGTGSYTVIISAISGPVIVKIKGKAGAKYLDEVTNTEKDLAATDSFRAVVPDIAVTTNVAVTPVTEVATRQVQTLATAGLSVEVLKAAIGIANTETATKFGIPNILVPPKPLTDATATTEEKKYATMLTLVSQIVNDKVATAGAANALRDAINTVLVQAVSADAEERTAFATALATAITNVQTAAPAALTMAIVAEVKQSVDTAVATVPTTNPAEMDTTAPTAPTALVSPSASGSAVALSWTASTDAKGVVRYELFRDGVKIGQSTATTFTDATVAISKTYSYTVKAFDAAGNLSAASAALSVTTPATTGPNLNVNVSGSVNP